MSNDLAPDTSQGGATPSGRAAFDDLERVLERTSDGGYQAQTVYVDGNPIATAVPFQEPLVWAPLPAEVMVRLSRFAYVHRVGHAVRLETPLSVIYLDFHDARATGIIGALAFDQTPAQVADQVGLPVDAVCKVLGLMRAMHAADPIVESRDSSEPIAAVMRWAAAGGIPGAWWTPQVEHALTELPLSDLGDSFELLWELHHSLTEEGQAPRADISLSLRDERGPVSQHAYREFDLQEDGAVFMGYFFRPDPANSPDAVTMDVGHQLAAHGHPVDWSAESSAAQLIDLLGAPNWVGITPAREGVRLVLPVSDPALLPAISDILLNAGIAADVVARLGLFATIIGQNATRLAVDVVGDGLGPRVGFEISGDETIALVPGLLDSLGVSASVITQLEATAREPLARFRSEFIPGVQTDEHSRLVSHVKVGFEPDGDVSVKTYIAFRNMPLAVGGRSVEDIDVPPTWEFHDLLFHARTRNGRVRERLGGTARFSVIPDLTEFPTTPLPGDIVLPPTDVAAIVESDRPFGAVMRARVSDRDWLGPEIPLSKLSELLARVMEVIPRDVDLGGAAQSFDGQPYPSGGGIYETDIVVLAHRVTGLEPGAYLYRRGSHSLRQLKGDIADFDALLFGAAEAAVQGMTRPQALLILAARFPDLAVKYQGIAYALMMKHVGVLQATIAYTAVAMGLGAVALGTGDSEAFARATGLDYYTQGSIGEIAISEPPRA